MNLASRDYREKRDFVRMKIETPVSVDIEQKAPIQGICHNLSGGGMLISIPEALQLGDKLVVTVSSDGGPMLKALTTVRRVGRPSSHACSHGLEIEEMID